MWNMLSSYKKDRIVLLTTHYMDEAEVLGDRIGIMNQGKMTVLGSSMFIKRTFGEGYELTVEKKPEASTYSIFEYIKHNLSPEITILNDMQDIITFKVPKSVSTGLSNFFSEFD